MKTARLIALVTALLLLLSGCAAGPETEKTQRQLYAMYTVMLLTAYGRTADAALDAAEARICELEADLDPERDGSSVREVNEHAGEWVRVSADCLSIAETANEIAAQSGGAQPKLLLVHPDRFEQAADIADRIAERNAIVLNLETAPKELTRRMLDFLSGVTYALGGKVKKVSGSTYIITPAGMDFMGDTGNAVESREKYF